MKRLSTHFTHAEFVHTDHRLVANEPTKEDFARGVILAERILEPLRAEFGPLRIHSWFRCLELNEIVGGSKTSAHMYGCAADLTLINLTDEDRNGVVDPEDVSPSVARMMRWLQAHPELPLDQAIDERGMGPGWLHVAIARPGHSARHEFLSYRSNRTPKYQAFK